MRLWKDAFRRFRVFLSGTNEQNVKPVSNRSKSEALRFGNRLIISTLRVCRLEKLGNSLLSLSQTYMGHGDVHPLPRHENCAKAP